MDILLLTLVFAPDGVSTATILTELAQRLRSRGHKLTVVTTTPHYNEDATTRKAQPLRPKWGRWLMQSSCSGIPVFHVRMRGKGDRILGRLWDYVRFHCLSTLSAPWLARGFRVVLAPSPPLTIGVSAAVLAFLRRAAFVYNVQEIYPDIAVSLGVLRNRFLVRALEILERWIYRRADVIVVISERFRTRLLQRGVPAGKLRVIPNFVDVDFVRPQGRHNEFSSQHGLDRRFVLLYAGNIGLTQDMDTLFEAAGLLRDCPEVHFLFVGDGVRRKWLTERIGKLSSPNVSWLPYQPKAVVPAMYAASDMCLVPQRPGTALDTFPSKVYTIMAAGRPVLAAADPNSELAAVVEQSGAGFVVSPGDAAELARVVREVVSRPERLAGMGRTGRDYAVRHHAPDVVAAQYHALMLEIGGLGYGDS